MRKGQRQIRCSSGVSIAGRIDSLLQIQGLPPPQMRDPRGHQQGQVPPEMGKSGGDAAVHPPHGGDTEMLRQGKDVLHLLDADVAHRLPHAVADLPLLLEEGLLPHRPVVVLHPPDDFLPLSSVATAPPRCLYRRGSCLALPRSALLRGPSAASQGRPSAEVLLLKGDAHLPPPLHPDTGGAPCCLPSGQAGIYDPLLPAAPLRPLQTAVAPLGVPPVLKGVLKPPVHPRLTSGDSSPLHTVASPSAECPAPQSHATTRDHLQVPSL